MYVGDTANGSGLHRMVYELVDNAINEALAGHCDRIEMTLNADGSATVHDNGRGIPTDKQDGEGVSAAETIMTCLHVSARLEPSAQQMPGRLRGVGVAVVNALSEVLYLRIWRAGKEHFMRFRMGEPEAPLAVIRDADMSDQRLRHGTEIAFLPSKTIFTDIEFNFDTIERYVRGLILPNSGVVFTLTDKRGIEEKAIIVQI
jgi:DNA gyrase subunit B